MKKTISFALLILVSSMVFGGITNSAHAQTDPSILLKIAKQAQAENRTVKDVALERKLLSPAELEKIFSRKNLLNEQ